MTDPEAFVLLLPKHLFKMLNIYTLALLLQASGLMCFMGKKRNFFYKEFLIMYSGKCI
jgi:hypothetical protein